MVRSSTLVWSAAVVLLLVKTLTKNNAYDNKRTIVQQYY